MSIDLKRTWYQLTPSSPLAAAATVGEEGQALVAVLEDGKEKVKPSAGTAGEVFVGFAVYRQKSYGADTLVDSGVIPNAAPYVIQLEQNNLIVGQIRVADAANTAFTVQTTTPAAGQVQVDYVNGTLTFAAADAGKAISAAYRYNMTVAEASSKYHASTPNHPDANLFASVGVGKGKGQLYTNYYDAAQNFADPAAVLTVGANGIITVGGVGTPIPGARVISVPNAMDPYLGIEFLA